MTLLSVLLQDAAAAAPKGFLEGSGGMILMMVALFAIMYLFMIRPQQKKQKALQEARNAITTGDSVITAGGVHGKIKEIGDTYFIVEISDGVKIKIEKASIYVSPTDANAARK